MKNIFLLLLCLSSFVKVKSILGQEKYPQNYFRNPLDIPIVVTGTFGELRFSHFHSGIDLNTQKKEGLKIYASAKGYVSRIKVSNWGFGKALYITHPNGYTTVYAHLKKFNKKNEKRIRQKQYQLEKYEIEFFPRKNELTISKGDIIAYSGSTGGFIDPHLHFEIRDTKTEKIINPMLFGINTSDNKAPKIAHLRAYALNDSSHVNRSNIPIPINIKQIKENKYVSEQIDAYGIIGFGINTYDLQKDLLGKNGIYKIEMSINKKKIHEHVLKTFSFNESKFINLLMDYPYFAIHNRKYQKTYIHPENKLKIYKKTPEKGYIKIEDGLKYEVVIKVSDFSKNYSSLTIPLNGDKKLPLIKKIVEKTDYFIKHSKPNSFKKKYIKIDFPANTFYDDFYLNLKIKDSIVSIHKPEIPLNKSYTVSFDVSRYTKPQKEKLYIANINNNKYFKYVPTIKTDSIFETSTKILGDFKLHSDNTKPKIYNCSFYEGQNLTNHQYFTIQVKDDLSGLKSYRGEIDGKWILLELDLKTDTLTYDLTYDINNKKMKKGKHVFHLYATDNVGNTCKFASSFYLK